MLPRLPKYLISRVIVVSKSFFNSGRSTPPSTPNWVSLSSEPRELQPENLLLSINWTGFFAFKILKNIMHMLVYACKKPGPWCSYLLRTGPSGRKDFCEMSEVPQCQGESLNVAHAAAICLYELSRDARKTLSESLPGRGAGGGSQNLALSDQGFGMVSAYYIMAATGCEGSDISETVQVSMFGSKPT